ncbi:MAG: hypothetical protein HY216_04940 [Candidatus Rokubacteria bacterium]|nr:hypothetical protein [Candidatus Rokubacteria bacterium]
MTFRSVATVLGVVLAAGTAGAQTSAPPRTGRPVRVVLARGAIRSVADAPQHFRLIRLTLAGAQPASFEGPDGGIYVVSGALEVAIDGERRSVREGGALFISGNRKTTLTAAPGAQAVALHFLIGSAPAVERAAHSRPATVTELYRTREPLPNLKPGPHEFSLTRVSVDKGVPPPPMHHRSGAALYYVLSGTWAIHLEGKQESRARGAVQLEPNGFVHTWENVGETSAALIQANISAEGTPEIIFLSPR